ncbi:hypothetical protein N0V83_002876 [Neocucurbitaria cava]|uniref:Uncharacterized protein n=1 Tax=Neocucurbitaria cava TaxID=798079 RepID=A0A9W8YCD4_9PLEO|nr:hypothetical protein N0V83_002876 [Neocucurbitaria cava]
MLGSGEYYDDDDVLPRSPGLKPIVVDPTPIPSPPPTVTVFLPPPRIQNVSSSSSRRHRKSNRRKTRPTQGDQVLIRAMAPNLPDLAQQVSEQALNSDSGSEIDEEDEQMEDESPDPAASSRGPNAAEPAHSNTQPVHHPKNASSVVNASNVPTARLPHRDSVVEADDPKLTTLVASQPSNVAILPSHARLNTNGLISTAPGTSTLPATSPNQPTPLHGAITNGHPHDNFLATSPRLQQLTISQSRGSVTDTLPALQTQSPPRDGSVSSPSQQQQLPSFRHIDDIARSATSDQEVNRTNGFLHRQSISSVGQSPTSIVRQLSISSHSPATPFPPLSASSPVSASSELQRGDIFLRTGGASVFGADARRPSQASDGGPYASTLHSASTSESYQSSDGLSPGTAQTPIEGRPRLLSLDGALSSRLLPPPVGSGIQHVPSHGTGAFKCDYPNCNAQPFQTQYLLK